MKKSSADSDRGGGKDTSAGNVDTRRTRSLPAMAVILTLRRRPMWGVMRCLAKGRHVGCVQRSRERRGSHSCLKPVGCSDFVRRIAEHHEDDRILTPGRTLGTVEGHARAEHQIAAMQQLGGEFDVVEVVGFLRMRASRSITLPARSPAASSFAKKR